jgi:hypothetical protein
MVLPDRSKSANTTANRENSHNERKVNISVEGLQAAMTAADIGVKAGFV